MSISNLPDGTVPVLLSANSPELLRAEAQAVLVYVAAHDEASPAAVAQTLLTTRAPRRCRTLIRASSREELIDALTSVANGAEHPAAAAATASSAPKTAFVFPGQGGQHRGMGTLYYERSEAFRAEAQRCDESFRRLCGHSPLDYLLDRGPGCADRENAAETASPEETASVAQPALFLQMAGLAAMWRAAGVIPDITVGHSVGEVVAAYAAGRITLDDAVRVVRLRANTVDKLSLDGFAMVILGMSRDACELLLAQQSGWGEVAVVNSANLVGLCGDPATMARIAQEAQSRRVFTHQMRSPYPGHISLLNAVRADFIGALAAELEHAALLDSPTVLVSAATGEVVADGIDSSEHWFKNLRNVVRFDRATTTAALLGVEVFVEISDHPALGLAILETVGMLEAAGALRPERTPAVVSTSRRTASDLGEFSRNLASVAVLDANFPWAGTVPWAAQRGKQVLSGPILRGFPNSPMSRTRFWTAPTRPDAEPLHGAPRPALVGAERVQVVQEQWKPAAPQQSRALGAVLVVDPMTRCPELVAQLRAAAAARGCAAAPDVDTVLVLLPELPRLDGVAAAEESALFWQAHHRLPGTGNRPRRYLLVTAGGERAVETDPSPNLFHSAIAASLRCVAREYPEHRFAHLDLEAGTEPLRETAEQILDVAQIESEPELAARGGALHAKRWSPAPESDIPADLSHVVVVGGTGSFSQELCEHLCAQGARAITLVSRSGQAAVDSAGLGRLRARFGARIEVVSCDVTDAAAVRELAGAQRMPASLVLHAAVRHVHTPLVSLDQASARRAFGAKVIGAQNVLEQWPLARGGRVVLFSSVVATIGWRGQALYAAANRMLDALADEHRRRGVDCVSVQWGVWCGGKPLYIDGRGVVENVDLLSSFDGDGLPGMDPDEAARIGLSRQGANTAVLSVRWPQLHAYLDDAGCSALLSEFAADAPPLVGGAPQPEPKTQPRKPQKGLADHVRSELADVMGLAGEVSGIDGSVPLVALGMDSLQALELRKRVRIRCGCDLPLHQVMGGASLDDVVELVSEARMSTRRTEVTNV